jgi:hypothetical protein
MLAILNSETVQNFEFWKIYDVGICTTENYSDNVWSTIINWQFTLSWRYHKVMHVKGNRHHRLFP